MPTAPRIASRSWAISSQVLFCVWEKSAGNAIERASKTLRDLRIAEISTLDMQLKDGKIESFRARVKVSFKFEG